MNSMVPVLIAHINVKPVPQIPFVLNVLVTTDKESPFVVAMMDFMMMVHLPTVKNVTTNVLPVSVKTNVSLALESEVLIPIVNVQLDIMKTKI